jgi:hypothetical protein
MLDQYKKTFAPTQAVIAMIAVAVLRLSHSWGLAGLFFLTMQLAAVIGAAWALRLRGKLLQGHPAGTTPRS